MIESRRRHRPEQLVMIGAFRFVGMQKVGRSSAHC
jgi:hypothetical protein